MKIDRLAIRQITGFVFLAILSIVILLIRPKEQNEVKGFYYPRNNINTIQDEKINIENNEKMTKEQLFSLLDNGIKKSDTVNAFEYSRELLENNYLTPIFKRDEYSNIIKNLDINIYKEDRFNFITMQNTNEFVWGYFIEKSENTYSIVYIIVDKTNGRIKNINSDAKQIIID